VQKEQSQARGLKLLGGEVVMNERERFPQWQPPCRTFDSATITSLSSAGRLESRPRRTFTPPRRDT
jgi:hypothetical protein